MKLLVSSLILAAVGHTVELPNHVQSRVLDNGLTVLVAENHAVPLVTIEIGVKNGSMTEPPEYSGLSHLYEHMFFKGNAVLPTQEAFLERTGELGVQFDGTTEIERVTYFSTTTTDHLHDAMSFMRDALVSPLFDAGELERERAVVVGELDRKDATPAYHLFQEVQRHVWWKYPERKIPVGRRETVLKATAEQMRTIQHRYYVPNNSLLVVSGDVSAADIFQQAAELYAQWKRGPDPFVRFPSVKHPPIPHSQVVIVEQPVHTVTGQFVWQGPSTVGPSAKDSFAAEAFSKIVNWPSSSFQTVLVGSGACVSASMDWQMQANTGPITLAFEAVPEKADACVRAIVAVLSNLTAVANANDADLRHAAHELEVRQVRLRQRPIDYAHALTFWWTAAGLDYYASYVSQLEAVRQTDVERYVNTYISAKSYVFAVMVSANMRANGLDAAHFEALLGLTQGTP